MMMMMMMMMMVSMKVPSMKMKMSMKVMISLLTQLRDLLVDYICNMNVVSSVTLNTVDPTTMSGVEDVVITKSPDFKMSGSSHTRWMNLVWDLDDATLDHDYICHMPLCKTVPVFSYKGSGSLADVMSFLASLLVRTSNSSWELMNEYDNNMIPLEWEGDEGLQHLFGMEIKQANEAFWD